MLKSKSVGFAVAVGLANVLPSHATPSGTAATKKAKFILDGAHFKEIGESYDYQNPIYLIRKLPENVYRLDGTQAFPGWTGGWLGVALKEMEQHNEMHKEWYIQD